MTDARVMCVDDDVQILRAFKRVLGKQFAVTTAPSGEEGLLALTREGPFAVVVSDQRMPGMDGIHFLSTVRQTAPDTVRIMLTGIGDQQTASDAVNEGHIFRFLNKPCAPQALTKAVTAGVEQHRLITAERTLLHQTLAGSVKMLVDILGAVNPSAFSHAGHIRGHATRIAAALRIENAWQIELAATLSLVGCVTVPSRVLEAYFAGTRRSPQEERMIEKHPDFGRDLVARIPRLEVVAEMIGRQNWGAESWGDPGNAGSIDRIATGARILKVATDCDVFEHRGLPAQRILHLMAHKPDVYEPFVVAALETTLRLTADGEREGAPPRGGVKILKTRDLHYGIVLDEELRTKNGMLLVSKGSEINGMLLERIRNHAAQDNLPDTVRVMVPASVAATKPT